MGRPTRGGALRVVRRERDGVSLLSNGELTTKLDLHVYRASKGAAEAVEKAGGSLKTDYVPKRKRERGASVGEGGLELALARRPIGRLPRLLRAVEGGGSVLERLAPQSGGG
mgnify:CR=1 FL=1